MATREFRRLKQVRRMVLLFIMSRFVYTDKSLLEISHCYEGQRCDKSG